MDDIQCMVSARDSLERYSEFINLYIDNMDYKRIYDSIIHYIKTNCNHKIVEDFIDIGMDKTVKIEYCEICFTTFENDLR